MNDQVWDVIVIGAGPAGIMAAYSAASRGLSVLILEKNEKIGKKLFLSGKGRCNITNNSDISEFFDKVVHNPKFLMSAFYSFPNTELLSLLNKFGLATKAERGGRVFPVSDKSSDVLKTLDKMLDSVRVSRKFENNVAQIEKKADEFIITTTEHAYYQCKSLVLATGGVSYPSTGSTGEGMKFAETLGHTVVPLYPALIGLEDSIRFCQKMQGLALKNICFKLFQNQKKIYEEQGELLFTHFGISGPVVLSASCYIDSKKQPLNLYAELDLKPALDQKKLDARILREFDDNKNKQLKNVMSTLLPSKMIHPFLQKVGIKGEKDVHLITKEEREHLVLNLKAFPLGIAGPRPIEEAIITSGGINVKEINPSTMESKKIKGLYLVGEMLDVHALTGGYNLQIAFSTGCLAGNSIEQ